MDDKCVIINTNRNKAELTARPVWVTNGRRSAVIAVLGSSLRMLQFRLCHGWAFPEHETRRPAGRRR